MTPSLTHLAFHVQQLEACIAFYREYCGLKVVHRRRKRATDVAWLAEEGRENDIVIILLAGGIQCKQSLSDYSHLGFAVDSKEKVDAIARRAEGEGILVWDVVQEDFPVGYYCGVTDPNGAIVEFSYGQPLGPGTESMLIDR